MSIDMVIENNELRLLPPPPGGSKGFAGAAQPVSSVQKTQQMSKFCTFTHIVQNRQHLPNLEAALGRQHIRASVLNVCSLFT